MKKIFIIHILLAMPLLAWCDNINFTDAEVKAICVKNWDTNGDGELSKAEAAAVTDIGTVFQENTSIKSFDELQYFTSLQMIARSAFIRCSNLTSVTIPNSVTSIGNYAFEECSSLTSVTIPNSVTSIGNHAFWGCVSLTSVTIPNSVTSIGTYAFYQCSSLTSVTIPNSVTSIGTSAFFGCTGLTSVNIPNSIKSIESGTFQNCSSLTSIDIPSAVTSIGGSAFSGCSSLTSINIPSTVTSIGNQAFISCSNLTSITIPNTVTGIGADAFMGCRLLKEVRINDLTSWLNISFKDALSNPCCYGAGLYLNGKELQNISFPNTINEIKPFAFAGCRGLISITIPNSVTTIHTGAFDSCSSLKSVKVESNKPFKIDSSTFPSNVVIFVPKGCKEAYQSADGWKNYIISEQNPNEAIAFADAKVKEICVKNWDTNGDGELSYGEAAAVTDIGTVFKENTSIKSFDEFQYFYGLESIGEYAFDKCTNLKSVKLPDYLKKIGHFAFGNCKALKSIVIPKSVNFIYWVRSSSSGKTTMFYCNPFLGCNSLESIVVESGNESFDSRDNCNAIIHKSTNTLVSGCKNTVIPNSISILGFTAFVGCEDLVSVVIPYNVSEIQKGAFVDCKNLSMITIDGGVKMFDSSPLPDEYWYGKIKKGTFEGCLNFKKVIVKNLADWSKSCCVDSPLYYAHHLYSDENTEIIDLVIPNGVDNVGYGAFRYCSYLKSVIIPNSVKVINGNAFQGCTSLTSVTIPNSVTEINDHAFYDCPKLSAIIWDADFTMPNYIVNGNTTNMLFYTKDASYAPSNIRNVIVNGTAKEIVLSDVRSGNNNFYCPRVFTAEKISYTHNYKMTSGLDGQARGWETIALPFTVGEITHESKGKLLPFGAWTSTSDAKPFWLCKLSSSGFTRATSIEANTPYIICMPNNNDYDSSFNLSGNVTFSATNVKVPVSNSVTTVKSNDKTFIPAFCAQDKASTVYALNVNNSYHTEAGGYTEGSAFVSDLRAVSPFEAYMTTDATNAKRAFLIEFSETTGIDEMPSADNKGGLHKVFNLNGQLVKKANTQSELDETLKQLPTGVYIINGKKTVIKR